MSEQGIPSKPSGGQFFPVLTAHLLGSSPGKLREEKVGEGPLLPPNTSTEQATQACNHINQNNKSAATPKRKQEIQKL